MLTCDVGDAARITPDQQSAEPRDAAVFSKFGYLLCKLSLDGLGGFQAIQLLSNQVLPAFETLVKGELLGELGHPSPK